MTGAKVLAQSDSLTMYEIQNKDRLAEGKLQHPHSARPYHNAQAHQDNGKFLVEDHWKVWFYYYISYISAVHFLISVENPSFHIITLITHINIGFDAKCHTQKNGVGLYVRI